MTVRNITRLAGPIVGATVLAGSLASGVASAAQSSNGINAALLYHNYCSVCHGDKGDGNSRAKHSLVPPPKDFTAGELPRDYMLAVVANGKPGTAMVGWKTQLNPNEIAAVVDFVIGTYMHGNTAGVGAKGLSGISAHGGRERDAAVPAPAVDAKPAGATTTVKSDMNLPFPSGLKGDRAKGEKFYLANCATCHGAKGDGKGPRAYFINPKPRNFLDDEPRRIFNRPALYAAIAMGSQGTEMPAWSKVLTDQEIADVGEYVFQAYIRSEAKSATASK